MSDGTNPPMWRSLVTEECAICTYIYRHPKLLACKHTFCSICLKKSQASAKDQTKIQCPVCRQTTLVPQGGNVDVLPTNFFVSSLVNTYICDSCDLHSHSPLRECGVCAFCLCPECFECHGKVDIDTDRNKCRADESDSDDDVYPDDLAMRSTIRHLCAMAVKSCYCGNIRDIFKIDGATCVTKIVPVSQNSAWMLVDQNPQICKVSTTGTVEDKRSVSCGKTLDICWTEKHGLLAICEGVTAIFRCSAAGSEVVIDTGPYIPSAICSYRHDGLIVGGLETESSGRSASYVLLYDSKCNLASIKGISVSLTFKHITSLTYNIVTQQVCVADKDRNMVYILGDSTCQTYRKGDSFPVRRRSLDIQQPDEFTPWSVCCDQNGGTFVFDKASSSIHVLSAKGKMLGMLLGNDEDHTGDPNCICFGPDGRFWVGDMRTGQVRIYSVDQYCNGLQGRHSRYTGVGEALFSELGHIHDLLGGSTLSEESFNQLASSQSGDSLEDLARCPSSNSGRGIMLRVGLNGIEITSSQEPDNPEANRVCRMAFASQVLSSPRLQLRLSEQGLSVDDVVRACTDDTR